MRVSAFLLDSWLQPEYHQEFHHPQDQLVRIQVVWTDVQIGVQMTWVWELVDVMEFEFLACISGKVEDSVRFFDSCCYLGSFRVRCWVI